MKEKRNKKNNKLIKKQNKDRKEHDGTEAIVKG